MVADLHLVTALDADPSEGFPRLTEGKAATSGRNGVDTVRLVAPLDRRISTEYAIEERLGPVTTSLDGLVTTKLNLETSSSLYIETNSPPDLPAFLTLQFSAAKALGGADNVMLPPATVLPALTEEMLVEAESILGRTAMVGEPSDMKVTRLDLADDVRLPSEVSVSMFIRALGSIPVRYGRRSRVYFDEKAGSAQTAYRGSGARGSRAYDKHAESGSPDAVRVVRLESQYMKDPLAQAALKHAGADRMTVGLAAELAEVIRPEMWDHFGYGSTLTNVAGLAYLVGDKIRRGTLPEGLGVRALSTAVGSMVLGFAGAPERSRRRYLGSIRSLGVGVDLSELDEDPGAALRAEPIMVRAVLGQFDVEVLRVAA